MGSRRTWQVEVRSQSSVHRLITTSHRQPCSTRSTRWRPAPVENRTPPRNRCRHHLIVKRALPILASVCNRCRRPVYGSHMGGEGCNGDHCGQPQPLAQRLDMSLEAHTRHPSKEVLGEISSVLSAWRCYQASLDLYFGDSYRNHTIPSSPSGLDVPVQRHIRMRRPRAPATTALTAGAVFYPSILLSGENCRIPISIVYYRTLQSPST